MSKISTLALEAIAYIEPNLITNDEIRLILLVVTIAAIASYTALKLARNWWLIGSAIALGIGIWAIYLFVLLGDRFPLAINQNPSLVLLSIGIAILPTLILVRLNSLCQQQSSKTAQADSLHSSTEPEFRLEERIAELRKANERLQLEIAEHKRAEEEVGFLQKIAQAISEAVDFHSALGVVLRKICNFTDWKFGEAWIPTPDGQILEYSPAWYGTSQNLEKFGKFSQRYKFTFASGLPGRVWSSKQPEWIQDVSSEPENVFPRKQLASEVGFKTGLGIPIIDNNQVLAVLVFFMFESCEEDKRLVEIVSTVATQLGFLMQRKRAEEALRQSEEHLQAILDNSTALIYVKDTEGKYLLINAWYSILFHLDRAGVIGKTDYDIFPREIADVFRANDQKVLESKIALDWEEVFPHDDGLHTYLSIKFPLYNTAGEPYAVCGISTDITERKRAEDALRSSMATNRALLNAIPDLMFRISREGVFVNFKAAKDNNLLMPHGEFLGKHLYDVFPTEVAQPIINCVEQALATGEVQILECQIPANNELFDYEVRIAVSAKNEVMAIVRDITERKRAEAEIRSALKKEKELSELKSRFITMASHEFRTPLATILSSTELLEYYSYKWSEEKKLIHFHRIQAAVKHMTQLLNDVLLIGKAEAGKIEAKPTPIDLLQFCGDLVEEIQLTANSYRTIAFRANCQCITACIDEKLLRQILSNLLSNAIKYSPDGSSVNFELVCDQTDAIFRIQDRGIGIPITDQAQLFNSFHRASNVGTISGTGLGLAIVKKSVDLHGGSITFESAVGVGTTFTVTLPLNY
jgi:PAS domain S-box-containing protein